MLVLDSHKLHNFMVDIAMRLRVPLLPSLATLLVAGVLADAAMAAPASETLVVRPLPMNDSSNDKYGLSGLYLAVEEEPCDKKASEVFRAAPPESADGVAYQVLKAIAKKDAALLRQVGFGYSEVKAKQVLASLARLGLPEDPTVIRIYRLGNASYYVIERHDSQQTSMSILVTPKKGKYYFDLDSLWQDNLCNVISTLNQAIAQNPSLFMPRTTMDGYQSIDLPPVFEDKDRKHPLRLYFKGMHYVAKLHPLSDSAVKELPTTGNSSIDGAVTFYAKLLQALGTGNVDAFLAHARPRRRQGHAGVVSQQGGIVRSYEIQLRTSTATQLHSLLG